MNRPSSLPNELRAFLYSCIDSMEQADLLVRMRRAPHRRTVRELAEETGLASGMVRHHLETMAARGLLHVDVGEPTTYQYAPDSADMRRYSDLLAEYYATDRDGVARYLLSRAARTFADAFKLRKDE